MKNDDGDIINCHSDCSRCGHSAEEHGQYRSTCRTCATLTDEQLAVLQVAKQHFYRPSGEELEAQRRLYISKTTPPKKPTQPVLEQAAVAPTNPVLVAADAHNAAELTPPTPAFPPAPFARWNVIRRVARCSKCGRLTACKLQKNNTAVPMCTACTPTTEWSVYR